MSDTLSKATSILQGAEKKFPASMAKAAGVTPASERTPHEYSNASYQMAHKAKSTAAPTTGVDKEIGDVASGIKWRQEQSKVANDATQPK